VDLISGNHGEHLGVSGIHTTGMELAKSQETVGKILSGELFIFLLCI